MVTPYRRKNQHGDEVRNHYNDLVYALIFLCGLVVGNRYLRFLCQLNRDFSRGQWA